MAAAVGRTLSGLIAIVMVMAYLAKGEREEKLRVYMHATMLYKNVTFNTEAVVVQKSPGMSSAAASFGEMHVVDNPLTNGRSLTSSQVGSAQGVYAYCSRSNVAAWWSFTAFLDGRGTVIVMGVEQIIGSSFPRVLSVVGGTGDFANARGSVLFNTTAFKFPTFYVVSLDFTLLLPS
ncbi:hypothetical protein KP509_16G037000 [Ceratopteris richardii]|uniref:Dirigent protein n=1 Tax=Ceratopteris richardii TaxID=49495 RepID=A0A8T2SZZ8_CERRI|nr:hypothetical protein KP509_16G037000 [Ceratopteris richardii]